MHPDEAYRLVAQVTAHELLLRELFLLFFGRMDEPLESFDAFARRLRQHLSVATVPQIHAAQADLITRELAVAVDDVIAKTRGQLAMSVGRGT
jgi:hypothetical protein